MSDDGYGATVAKRRLARTLTELRVEKGWTANQVCDRLSWGRGKVGRFEMNAWKRPEMSDIRDLLRLYEVPDERQREVEALAVQARTRTWWRDYGDVFANEFPGYEADAAEISVYKPLVLPGLLQTGPYMDAHLRIGTQSPAWQARAKEARLRRQQILDRQDETTPLVRVVITEASLMYHWGTSEQRRDQVLHLVEMNQRPHIDLRLLRFADGLHPGSLTSIDIFDFPDADDPPLAYLESELTLTEVSAEETNGYRRIFERTTAAALEPDASTDHLKQLAERLE